MLYSRPQLRLLLVLAALFLAGLAVRQWRAGFPDTAQWLERFDSEEPVTTPLLSSRDPSPTAAPKVVSPAPTPARPAKPAPTAEADTTPVDINRATVAELARLPGVGPGLAQRILEERERRGRYDSPDALRRVVGIGPKKLAALRDLVTVRE